MFKLNFLWFVLMSLWFFQLNEMFGQECVIMHTKKQPYVMGLEKMVDVDLDDVDTVTLPVVFHVVHTGTAQENNISDEQIFSQVAVLNEEFEDSKIQFCMAVRDPDGNPTNGITRYDASWNDQYVIEGVNNGQGDDGWDQQDMKENSGCWNPDEYINYYVVSEINGNDGGNGIQGFAYLGPTGDCRDGVVVLYNATGTVGVQKPGRTLGFTGVHEMGHHLSLWHTFSNTSSCTSESNCETQGDQVCDTPTTLSNSTSQCDGGVCPGALVNNFMDYSSEACKNAFTVGQAERMHEMLQSSRQGLVDNLACVPVVDYDVTAGAAYYQQEWCTPYQDIWVDVINQGTQLIPFVDVEMFCNGPQGVVTLYDVPPGSTQVLFQGVYVEGADEFTIQTISSLDEFPDNDASWWPLDVIDGDLMEIWVTPDVWANETSWELRDGEGEVVISGGDYEFNSNETFYYEACIFDDCYVFEIEDYAGDGFCTIDFDNDGVCDIGSDGVLATVGLDTLVNTGFGLEFDVIQYEFCNYLSQCNMDYDGDGYIGSQDVLELLVDLGCEGNCYTDPNNDQIVNIQDLLLMLASTGPCPKE